MVIHALALMVAMTAAPVTPVCTVDAQRAWAEVCTRNMRPNGERRTETWSNADVWLEGDFPTEYAAHCRASAQQLKVSDHTTATQLTALDQFFRRAAEAASTCPLERHLAWVQACFRDAEALVPGRTRADLLRSFSTEGGINIPPVRRFVHRQCTTVHITVHFDLVDAAGMTEQQDDVIQQVDGPYLAPYFAG